jgi:hypothetical protein
MDFPKTSSVLGASVSRSSSGDGSAVVAAPGAGKRIRVVAFALQAVSPVVVLWKSGTSGVWAGADGPAAIPLPAAPAGAHQVGDENLLDSVLPDVAENTGLFLNLGAAVSVSGAVFYRVV